MARSLGERFREAARQFAQDTAIRHLQGVSWANVSYGELLRRVESAAAFLAGTGVRPGDKVAILLENGPEWPTAFFATLVSSAVAVPINTAASDTERESIIKDSGSVALFTFTRHDSGTLKEKCPSLKKIICVDTDEFTRAPASSGRMATYETGPSDLACILYTSGTTAAPKGVMLTHENLLSNAEAVYGLGIFSRPERMISILPLHHAYPLTVTMIMPLIFGGTVVYPKSLRPEDISSAMAATDPSVFIAVPQILYSFHARIVQSMARIPFPFNIALSAAAGVLYWIRRKTGVNLSRRLFGSVHKRFGKGMRFLASGGAKLDEKIEAGLFRFGFTVLEGYGLTETSPVLTFSPPEKPKIGSVGIAMPGVKLRIEREDRNGAGEVVASGPNIMRGYYNRKDETDAVLKDGWFYTGDLGRFDADGYLYLTGRRKDVIVLSSGVNIYPEDVEEHYGTLACVKEICIIDVPFSGASGERVALWADVVPDIEYFRKHQEVNLRHVIKERLDNVSRALPPHKRIMGFTITLESLPRTLLGKIKRFEVRERVLASISGLPREPKAAGLSGEERALAETETGRKVIECIRTRARAAGQIRPVDSLEMDLGIDSLGRIELESALASAFGAAIPDEVVGSSFTVGDIITGVAEFLKKAHAPRPAGDNAASGRKSWKELLEVSPKKENMEKIDLAPGALSWTAGFLFMGMARLFFNIFYRVRIEGAVNLPPRGPYILYANHSSYFDGPLIGAFAPRAPRLDLFFVGFRPYFNVPVVRGLIRTWRVIPLDFSEHFLEALRSAYYVLANGRCLCLFPEGMRTLTGEVAEFKKGFGIIAKESGARLVPIALEGTHDAWPRASAFPAFFKQITVRFGKPFGTDEAEEEGLASGAAESYSAINTTARKKLLELKGKR